MVELVAIKAEITSVCWAKSNVPKPLVELLSHEFIVCGRSMDRGK